MGLSDRARCARGLSTLGRKREESRALGGRFRLTVAPSLRFKDQNQPVWIPRELEEAEASVDRDRNRDGPGGLTLAGRPSRFVIAAEALALAGAVLLALATAQRADW